ncbi:hypothetical protein KSS93_04355 [Pseudomonas xanthosomatis]|uniref:hypothetical protein n=1 Tax=Pseudomonas xanthosomatis TaxID=2842356 RepID=UPI001C3C6B6F|nr:hypothetical protein [Pseudomonas xanthosomatis]QXH47162.1 hypothetical protein KSS93_04355 [Pseudomonas xanthosomatis]
MPFLARLRRLLRPEPQEQVLGYSIEQLKTQFGGKASPDVPAPCSGFTLDLMERGLAPGIGIEVGGAWRKWLEERYEAD